MENEPVPETETDHPEPKSVKEPVSIAPVKTSHLAFLGKVPPILAGGLLVILGAGLALGAVALKQHQPKSADKTTPSSPTASPSASGSSFSYDQKAAQQLAPQCEGEGPVTIIPPMKLDEIGSIQAYGLMVGGHVTPVDHQYYLGPDIKALRDTYAVVAPADAIVTSIQHRGSKFNTPLHSVNVPSSDEYRLVFAHTCSFLTYVDLVTSLSDSFKAKLPAGWTPDYNGPGVEVKVKQGEVVGYIGGQTLDFAVWDLSQPPLPGLLVRTAYDNAEQWKVFTAPPTKFMSEESKAAILPKYVRTAEPIDGKIDYDIEGKLIGTWFKVGSNGYDGGRATDQSKKFYWDGQLSFAPGYLDPTAFIISLGTFKSSGGSTASQGSSDDPTGATQFGIKGNAPDPATVDISTGLVKYELVQQELHNPDGSRWAGGAGHDLKAVNSSLVQGVILIQLLAPHSLKVEVFSGKTASQVSGFDDKAVLYNRGDDAVLRADGR